MKQYIAIVRNKETKNVEHITSIYKNKKHFTNDIRKNGYRVIAILTQSEVIALVDGSPCSLILKTPKTAVEYIRNI